MVHVDAVAMRKFVRKRVKEKQKGHPNEELIRRWQELEKRGPGITAKERTEKRTIERMFGA